MALLLCNVTFVMSLFTISKDGVLDEVHEGKIALERDLQTLAEKNLEKIFGLEFVSTEFQHENLRIDTLAFDNETNAFVIIEYKRDKSFSVVDQGFAYLSTLLNNKAEYILEYNEQKKRSMGKQDVDWSQTRVIFVAQSFTAHQKAAIGFRDLPIELWEARMYQNNIIQFSPLRAAKTTASIKSVSSDPKIAEVTREVKNYSIEDHTSGLDGDMKLLFEELQERFQELNDSFEEVPTKNYVGYKIHNKVIITLEAKKHHIRIGLNRTAPDSLIDELQKVEYLPNSFKHFHQHISVLDVHSKDELEYALGIVRQVVQKNKDL